MDDQPAISAFALRLAGQHLDPEEGVMRIGHVVTQEDMGALRVVLRAASAYLRMMQGGTSARTTEG
jgi:hypothetical protein